MKIVKCDICGSTMEIHSWRLPVYKMHDSSDGKTLYQHPKIHFRDIDICEECLMKSTNIYDDTVMGYGSISIRQNPELNARKEE